ncbi:GGDEF domain-containing protein [Cellulomonas cellasea]|uniref:GGDEF domain-containing protein n=2 Tax=Cellulomonas cellasea TaxID=43670 RepID=A0A0A0B9X0_9CELL|nr:GGDEF domain-containing protein [Cellulomonas cellasea]KGM03685.1 hypothetical protein Q760_15660 [Cellulomonas cellasea DSM 20118]GEA86937.1 hypothetical protein CCE01nite_08860 [Cellulomonas cellasea]
MRRVVAAVRRVLVVPEPDLVHRSRTSLVVSVGTGLGVLALLLTPVVTVLPYAEATVVTLLAASALSFTAAAVARRGHLGIATVILIVQLLAVLVVPSVHGRDGSYSPLFMAVFVTIAGALVRARWVPVVLVAAIVEGVVLARALDWRLTAITPDQLAVYCVAIACVTALTAVVQRAAMDSALTSAVDQKVRAEELARHLADVNKDLESRVSARTEELEAALSRSHELAAQLRVLSRRDPLTGLNNRRALDEAMLHLAATPEPAGLAVAVLDIDDFKGVNDRFGHPVGDLVLREVARTLQTLSRSDDVVARVGGEEFVVAMPSTSAEDALALCERIRAGAAALDVGSRAPGLAVTVSIGVTHVDRPTDPEELVRVADRLLYLAKVSGKNRVVADGEQVRAAART